MSNDTSKPSLMMNESYPLAGFLCLLGFFLHIVLSDPLLMSLGIHYSGDEGRFYEKIHPGTVFIFLSFFVLLISSGSPIRLCYALYRQQFPAICLLVVTLLMFFYMSARSGPTGLAFLIDTHMTPPLAALVLAYTPSHYCRRAVHFFIFIACINSLIGIAEAIWKFRIFEFNPDWGVLKERYFRASALRGHPLNNAMFTAVALFTALAMRYWLFIKIILASVFLVSLIAFGGRAGLVFCIAGLFALCISHMHHYIKSLPLTPRRAIALVFALVVAPASILGGLYAIINSSIGERIAQYMQWDQSANSRWLALTVFHYMKDYEIWLGVSTLRVIDIGQRINQVLPLYDIENPWLLMFMYCGAIIFPFWLTATLAFIYRLIRDNPLALQLSVLGYFIIASTSNSFGRKDSTYLIMVTAVICAARTLNGRNTC